MSEAWEVALLNHVGEDIAHVHRIEPNVRLPKGGWQAATYWCTLGGTALIVRAECPQRKRKADAIADRDALGLPVR